MSGDFTPAEDRGISEVVGTVIIISMVILSALLIIAIGGMALQSLTDESEDSLARDSMQEMGSSLDAVSSSPVDTTETISFPEGSGANIQSVDDGSVNITARTHSDFEDEVTDSGTYYDEIDLGTIVQENDRGAKVAYQGGGLWRVEDGSYSLIAPPQFNYDGNSIDFSFVNVSSTESISEGQDLTATKDVNASSQMAAEIREALRPSMVHKDVDARVPVNVTVTIESRHWKGWEQYAREDMRTPPDEINTDPANNEVAFVFKNLGAGDINVSEPGDFPSQIIYAGPAYEAQFNSDVDAVGSGPAFTVNAPSYAVGMVHDDEWKVYHESDGDWKDLDDNTVPESSLPVTTSGSPVEYDFDSNVEICIVQGNADSFDSAAKLDNCEDNVDADLADSPEFAVDIDSDDYTVDVGDTLDVDVTVENVGDADGQQDVGLYDFDRSLADYEKDLSLDKTGGGSSTTLTLQWTPDETDVGEDEIIAASEDTGDTATVTVNDPEQPEFLISSYDVANKTVSEGEALEVEATVTNVNDAEGTQVVYLQGDDGSILAGETVTLEDSSDSETVSLDWATRPGDAGQNIEVYLQTADDSETINDVTVTPGDPEDGTFLLVDIIDSPDEVNNVERVELEANVTNVGADNGTQNLYLIHRDTGEVVDIVEDFDAETADTATFDWIPSRDDIGTNDLTVTSPVDSDTAEILVTGTPDTNYLVDVESTDDVVEKGQPFEVTATVNNTQNAGSELVVLYDVHGNVADAKQVNLSVAEERTVTFQWDDPKNLDPTADNEVEIRSEDDSATESVDIASQLLVDEVDTTRNTGPSDAVEYVGPATGASGYMISTDRIEADTVYTREGPGCQSESPNKRYGTDTGAGYDYVCVDGPAPTDNGYIISQQEEDSAYSGYTVYLGIPDDNEWFQTNDVTDPHYSEMGWVHEDDDEVPITSTQDEGDIATFYPTDEDMPVCIVSEGASIDPENECGAVQDDGSVDEPETLTATVTVENTGNEELGSEQIRLLGYEDAVSDSVTQTVSAQSDATVDLNYTLPERTGTVTVETDYDDYEETVVVQRDGPDCSAVSYDGSGTSDDPYEIRNVDELQCINDKGLDAHYELVDDIDAQGTEYWNGGDGFEPIGPSGHDAVTIPADAPWDTFKGVFDGNGHTITGLYIDRPDENYVGLFGATSYPYDDRAVGEGSTVKNVILEEIHVVGNTYVGGLAGQAGGEVINARAEGYVEAQEQLVGGLIGLGAHADINNRLVADVEVRGGEVPDYSWTVYEGNSKGIGGLIGRAAWETEIDTGYSQGDVRGPNNVGGLMGSSSLVDSEFGSMYSTATVEATDPNTDGGAIVGIVQSDGDEFKESLYWDDTIDSAGAWGDTESDYWNVHIGGVAQTAWNAETTETMTGTDTAQNLTNLEFETGPWVGVPDDYPRFEWELEAEGSVTVEIVDTNDPVDPREPLNVTVEVENTNINDEDQQIVLQGPDDNPVDDTQVSLDGSDPDDPNDSTTETLTWVPTFEDGGENELTVASEDMQTTTTVNVTGEETVDSEFDVSIEEYDDMVEVTEALRVNGTINNVGSEADSQYITLEDPSGALRDSMLVQNLSASDPPRTFNFTWETQSISEGDVVVRSYDDEATRAVEVTDDAAEFEVAISEYDDTVTAGENLTVNATIENVGAAAGSTQVSLTDSDGQIQNTTAISMAANTTSEMELTWNTSSRDASPDEEITVFTEDGSDSKDVTILGSDSQFHVAVTDWDEEVGPFETVELDVEVENLGDETDTQYLYLENPTGDGVVAIEEVSLASGASDTVEFDWQAGQAEDYAMTVRSDDDSDTVVVEVNSGGGTGVSEDDGVINVDLSVVDIS